MQNQKAFLHSWKDVMITDLVTLKSTAFHGGRIHQLVLAIMAQWGVCVQRQHTTESHLLNTVAEEDFLKLYVLLKQGGSSIYDLIWAL